MHKRKKLLYIGNKLSQKGGTVTSVETLGSFLNREGYNVITSSAAKNKVVRLVEMLVAVITHRKQVSYVLIDTYSTQNFYYALLTGYLCKVFKLQYIPILRGGNLNKRLEKNKFFSKILFENAYTNVAPSKFIFEQFKSAGFANITFIPNTVKIENYPFLQREEIHPKLLWVRSFAEIYNPILALEVVEILKQKGFEVALCMVGPEKDGALANCKKIAADLNLPVTFTGLLQKDEWIKLSKNYDIFLNTTNFDNMPVSVMEAMALGLPVISTNVGGMPYLIENGTNGILIPPNNANKFVTVIEKLCTDPLLAQKLAINARSKIEKLDWQHIKQDWKELLQ
ncbi:MAG: glycosyl transferase family 1 [Aequorivita sp.]|nr:glycosyl transferase family 1 [Aequorivita sp.]|tara:strand:+ start:32429 stop:33448 length:1020 start_codon:yes stop_codon:yes gene_type:complete